VDRSLQNIISFDTQVVNKKVLPSGEVGHPPRPQYCGATGRGRWGFVVGG